MTKLLRRVSVVVAAAIVGVTVIASPAGAHVVATPNTAETKMFSTSFRVGHGCAGSPTTAVKVEIPEGVYLVNPAAVPGFTLSVKREFHWFGRVVEVSWTGGSLPNDQVQLFGVSFFISRHAPAVLWFPTTQTCEVGEHAWVEIPPSVAEWGTVPQPSPYVLNSAWS